jgi:integrase
MARVRLKGVNSIRKRLADGSVVTYWYAWKGGPRLPGKPGSPEFLAAFNAAHALRKVPTGDNLRALTCLYRASPEFTGLADATRKVWTRWLDLVAATDGPHPIGALPCAALDDRRVRADLLAWRDQWAHQPRSADYAIQVLSRVLSWAMDRGLIALNPAAGIGQLYKSNRADQVWTDAEVAAFVAAAPSPEVGFIIRLACVTGLRREDLAALAWSHVGDVAIVKPTSKSRGTRSAIIPVLPETLTLLQEIRAQQLQRHADLSATARRKGRPGPVMPLTVLSNTQGRPWKVTGLDSAVQDGKASATPPIDKHLHDTRGTFGTRLRKKARLTAAEIAQILGWDEARAERLLAVYVDRDDIVRSIAERIRRNESGT